MKKILALVLSVVLVLGMFAGCGKKDDGGAANGANGANNGTGNNVGENAGNEGSSGNHLGELLLNVNAAVVISYDDNGMVANVAPYEGNDRGEELVAEYEDYLGKTCSEVVCDLIANSNLAGFLNEEVNYVLIKQVHGSTVPANNFLEGITLDAQAAIETAGSMAQLVVLTVNDLDGEGYINTDSAKKLMQAYMATDRTDYLCVGTDYPIDGMYGFLFGIDDIQEKLIVDAETGDVYEGELEGVDYGDEMLEEEEFIPDPTEETYEDVEDTEPPVAETEPPVEETEAAA